MNIRTGSAKAPQFTKYKVAAINYDPIIHCKDENIQALLTLTEQAATEGAKLIAAPEMGTTGYCWHNRAEVEPFVEPIPGPTTDKFAALAQKRQCWIVLGMPEVDPQTNIYYNSAVLIGPDGIVGVQRKTHPYISEPKWSKQGDLDHMVFETPIGNIGILICMDIHFIETARVQGLRGADIIVHVSNWLAEKTPAPYWLTRAFDNGCYVLESNRTGLERTVQFSGGSVLINPDGMIAAYQDAGNALMTAEVDIDRARRKDFPNGGNKYLERRPEHYMEIVHDPYLWNPLDFFQLYGYDPLPRGKVSKISVAQMTPRSGDLVGNLALIRDAAEKAASQGSELVVFPELTLSGFADAQNMKKLAISASQNPTIDLLIDIAMKRRLYLAIGLPERKDDKFYNAALLIGPEGVTGQYRKIHLSPFDREWATPGDLGFPHCNTPIGRIGIMIGHDALFPESGRMLALAGCDLLCCPSAMSAPAPYGLKATENWHNYPIPTGYSTIHWHLWRVRAGENNCYLAFANMCGDHPDGGKAFGRSGVFQPDTFSFPRSEVILGAAEDDVATIAIDTSNSPSSPYPTNVVRRKDLLSMRLPLWYDALLDRQPPVLELFK